MANLVDHKVAVKVYHGYGHMHDLIVYGHVFKNRTIPRRRYTNNILSNIIHLLRIFFVSPLPGVKVQLEWETQVIEAVSEDDGFFKLEWASLVRVPAGQHAVKVFAIDESGNKIACGLGTLMVPHVTQYGFISDIDDTVLVSHSATIFKRLRVLFTKNPQTRSAFEEVSAHYRMLSATHTTPDVPNPFFYVSSSEWNLYDDLVDFFRDKQLPEGAFLLSQVKKWYQLFKTGKTKHEGKLVRVYRIMKAFPKQKFVLLGDNSQSDPMIYEMIARKYPERIVAIYIRNIVPAKEETTLGILKPLEKLGVSTCLFNSNLEAITHSRTTGLIQQPSNSSL